MPAARRSATTAPPAGVNFLSLDMYAGGGALAEGDYALEFLIKVHQAVDRQTGASKGAARLGVMVTAHPINDDGSLRGEPTEHFYSMGGKADRSFAPDPENPKRLVKLANAPDAKLNNKTNWFLFLESLYNSGLPPDQLDGADISGLDGIWVHTVQVAEPEERKGFAQAGATTEVAGESKDNPFANQRPGIIAIVSEIKENGKPWEGTGGLPTAEPKPAARGTAPKGPKAVARPAPGPVEQAEEDDDLRIAAISAVTSLLEANPDGVKKLALRTGTFKAAKEQGNAVIQAFFGSDDALNGLLGELGYKVVGSEIKPA